MSFIEQISIKNLASLAPARCLGHWPHHGLKCGNIIWSQLAVGNVVDNAGCKKTACCEEHNIDNPNAQLAHIEGVSLRDSVDTTPAPVVRDRRMRVEFNSPAPIKEAKPSDLVRNFELS